MDLIVFYIRKIKKESKIMKKNKLLIIIYLIIIVLIFIIIVGYIKNGIRISKLNDMYNDIEILEDRISIYYLDNGNLPIINDPITDFSNHSINPNDSLVYYEIDLNKLENLNLFYGKGINGEKDKYIINEQSHTIYYYEGLQIEKNKIYTKKINYTLLDLQDYQ